MRDFNFATTALCKQTVTNEKLWQKVICWRFCLDVENQNGYLRIRHDICISEWSWRKGLFCLCASWGHIWQKRRTSGILTSWVHLLGQRVSKCLRASRIRNYKTLDWMIVANVNCMCKNGFTISCRMWVGDNMPSGVINDWQACGESSGVVASIHGWGRA